MYNTAIYPGTFDPFTNGHLDIVKKSAKIFNEVYVVIGINNKKTRTYDIYDMRQAVEETLVEHRLNNCKVIIYNGLIGQFTQDNNIGYMVRGLRNNMDYFYEENIAEVNKLINPEIEYVYFRADNVALSSSMVKELNGYGQDVSKYVPGPVFRVMKRYGEQAGQEKDRPTKPLL